ncbi:MULTISPECIES: pirin family protein [unclassified Pseudomonas]|uniref:pirin family protein n=1 Tax=unclassified Pseudomonas TaxID=196821 RepID=UPI00087719A9|nr:MULTISPECIES: pirin family protein [unclassified Pseudomonas]SCZ18606.1 Redox-sensitive bicupin YhaK, pirin superfamily [Pseudomonas sp. NFACC44-2]SDA81513.1 Redox-sensitive bicupin YhaK, pirin superfamily [Pseudomonas sp. NFACC51]SDW62024.1 Redox-sensitive bicupin YhaK, pirin superfamily [Pseudomonas sp. NFACC08-1]SEI39842.1 Redox-sensitive bicupin YhaK, pirin superfamily [Pseudomonas sp. NFACC07-1]SFG98336.1 Redox-sensitive bicupin YhaK, pirin superfamily [Pseudomonas sp. NFACC54]
MNSIVAAPPRAIVHRTSGNRHGPITRLMSPGDLGQLCKPFVFLDHFAFNADALHRGFGMHPHSGIATLTYMIEGQVIYEDTTGQSGTLPSGGMEWMQAGNGVWHTARPVAGLPNQGFQLWVALPAAEENAPARSVYLAPSEIPREGPALVLLGQYGSARSSVAAPAGMNYLAVQLQDNEHWRYTPPAGHTVAWLAVNDGSLDAGDTVNAGEMVVFDESGGAIDMVAQGATSFVLGSAVKHPHDLVMGYYSVHTSKAALEKGEKEIQRIGTVLQQEGRLA